VILEEEAVAMRGRWERERARTAVMRKGFHLGLAFRDRMRQVLRNALRNH
jgi:hypothetical protein